MNAKTKIEQAVIQLILREPFYATLVMHLSRKEDSNIKTACTDGKSISYNPTFIEKLTTSQTMGLLCHEVNRRLSLLIQ